MQGPEDAVEHDPHQDHQQRCVVVLDVDVGAAGFDVVLGELLLTPGALQGRGEEAQDHFHREYRPRHGEEERPLLHQHRQGDLAVHAEEDVLKGQQQKQHGPIHQPHIVQGAHGGEPPTGGFFRFGCHGFSTFQRISMNSIPQAAKKERPQLRGGKLVFF